jgi:C-5 cytosine-specific DNA methylase
VPRANFGVWSGEETVFVIDDNGGEGFDFRKLDVHYMWVTLEALAQIDWANARFDPAPPADRRALVSVKRTDLLVLGIRTWPQGILFSPVELNARAALYSLKLLLRRAAADLLDVDEPFENVLGLRYKKHAELFSVFKRLFSSAGFSIFEGELYAQDFGVSQVRKRIFVVGFNGKKYPNLDYEFRAGTTKRKRTVEDAIKELPKPAYFEYGLSSADIPEHPNHWCMKPRSKKFFNGYLKEGDVKGRPFRVLPWDKPSWTVRARFNPTNLAG